MYSSFSFPIPFSRRGETSLGLLFFLLKKLTVSGIIGNTQGVNNAAKPEPNAKIINDQRLSIVVLLGLRIELFYKSPIYFDILITTL